MYIPFDDFYYEPIPSYEEEDELLDELEEVPLEEDEEGYLRDY